MTSTPFILIESAFAIPPLRPLAYLPDPFGRDWAFLPVGQRGRPGLDSLYAALLHTVCRSDRRLLSYGQWVPTDGRLDSLYGALLRSVCTNDRRMPSWGQEASIVGVQRTVAQPDEAAAQPAGEPAKAAVAPRLNAQPQVPQGAMRIPLKARAPRIAQRHTAWKRRTLAASAGAIGSVAALAWWMVDQPPAPQSMGSNLLKSAQALMVHRDAPVQTRRSQSEVAKLNVEIAEVVTPAPVLSPLPAGFAAAPAPMTVSPQQTTTRHEPAPSEMPHSSPSRRVHRTKTHPQTVQRYAANESLHEARVSRVAVTQAPFAAGEYAGITTSATMSRYDVAPLPRLVVSNNLPANGTEWMNHMSQRRVTEIPEQFAQ
jgi:hypothetical protein